VCRQKTIVGAIQGQVNCLSDEEMEKMFDLEATIAKLKEEEVRLQQLIQNDPDDKFREVTQKFRL
jgi:hypothetical protein